MLVTKVFEDRDAVGGNRIECATVPLGITVGLFVLDVGINGAFPGDAGTVASVLKGGKFGLSQVTGLEVGPIAFCPCFGHLVNVNRVSFFTPLVVIMHDV